MDTIANAKRICPDIVIINGEVLTPYRRASQKIFDQLKQIFPQCPIERLGLDEFYIDVTRYACHEENMSLLPTTFPRNLLEKRNLYGHVMPVA